MEFKPRPADGSVNISQRHPIVDLITLVSALILLVAAFYVLLNGISVWFVNHLPVEAEEWIGEHVIHDIPIHPSSALQKRLTMLVRVAPATSPLHHYSFSVYLSDSDVINAVALPGGTVVVCKGLLKSVRSENELSMILAHELWFC